MVKDTCNVQVLIVNLVGIKQVSVDKYDENALLFFKQRHLKNLQGLFIGLLITAS